MPDDRSRVAESRRRADRRHRLRRPPRHHHAARFPSLQLEPRRLSRRHHGLGNDRRRRRQPSARSAAIRWPCCPSAATTWAITSATGSKCGRYVTNAAAHLPRQLVPQGPAMANCCGPASAKTCACSSGFVKRCHGSAAGRRNTRSAGCPSSATSTSKGSMVHQGGLGQGLMAFNRSEWQDRTRQLRESSSSTSTTTAQGAHLPARAGLRRVWPESLRTSKNPTTQRRTHARHACGFVLLYVRASP